MSPNYCKKAPTERGTNRSFENFRSGILAIPSPNEGLNTSVILQHGKDKERAHF